MSTYLAPCTSNQPLPSSASLSLLPFSLGSTHQPYKSSTASTSQYFQPRPCPANIAGILEGTPIAAFRGRQLVGHTIGIPQGYRGLVISAPQPYQVESKSQWPLTPAPSVASVQPARSTSNEASSSTRRSPRKSTLASVANTIKSKVRGAGQVALSKPKTRLARTETVKRKRYQLDSEDEDDDDQHVHIEVAKETTTPRKRTRGALASVNPTEDVPVIVVQEATPLKDPLPTPKKRLGASSAGKERMPSPRRTSASPSPSPNPAETETEASQSPENVIPSPATENDPPSFAIETANSEPASTTTASDAKPDLPTPAVLTEEPKVEADTDEREPESEAYTNARVLRPTSTFDCFTLWTPDGPLPGFKQDECQKADIEDSEEKEEGGIKLRKGWWRTGGAGEGGDEIVRALGEWIGLVEELNRPVYLDDNADSDEE